NSFWKQRKSKISSEPEPSQAGRQHGMIKKVAAGRPPLWSLMLHRLRIDQGQPAANSFWKHRKSKKSRAPLASQSAYFSPAAKLFWKHRKSKKSSSPLSSQSA